MRLNNPVNRTDPSGLIDTPDEKCACFAVCDDARKKFGAIGGHNICGPNGEQCACVFDLRIGPRQIAWNQCPGIQECIQAHENAHSTDPNQKGCTGCPKGSICLASADPVIVQAFHNNQYPLDVECLKKVADSLKQAGMATDICHVMAVKLLHSLTDPT